MSQYRIAVVVGSLRRDSFNPRLADDASQPAPVKRLKSEIAGSQGPIGTAVAQQHLRLVLAYLDVPALGQPEAFIQAKEGLFDDAGNVGAGSKAFLQGWMDRYLAWVKTHAARK